MVNSTLFAALLLMAMASITINASAICTDELVAFSPCLSYISSPPNNLSTSPSSRCCELYSSSFINGNASCLCYLLQQPSILGFPLNNTRIISLSSQCGTANGTSDANLELLCRETPTLPPLPAAPGLNYSPSPSPSAPSQSAAPSPTPRMSAPGTSTSGNTKNATAVNPSQTSGSVVIPPLSVYILWPLFVVHGLL